MYADDCRWRCAEYDRGLSQGEYIWTVLSGLWTWWSWWMKILPPASCLPYYSHYSHDRNHYGKLVRIGVPSLVPKNSMEIVQDKGVLSSSVIRCDTCNYGSCLQIFAIDLCNILQYHPGTNHEDLWVLGLFVGLPKHRSHWPRKIQAPCVLEPWIGHFGGSKCGGSSLWGENMFWPLINVTWSPELRSCGSAAVKRGCVPGGHSTQQPPGGLRWPKPSTSWPMTRRISIHWTFRCCSPEASEWSSQPHCEAKCSRWQRLFWCQGGVHEHPLPAWTLLCSCWCQCSNCRNLGPASLMAVFWVPTANRSDFPAPSSARNPCPPWKSHLYAHNKDRPWGRLKGKAPMLDWNSGPNGYSSATSSGSSSKCRLLPDWRCKILTPIQDELIWFQRKETKAQDPWCHPEWYEVLLTRSCLRWQCCSWKSCGVALSQET